MGQVPKEETFEGAGGLKIFMRSWRPDGAPRAIVVISHGFNSHSGQYVWVAEQLATEGFAVYAHDYRGRGLSEGERFHVEHVDEYVGDLVQVVGIAKARDPGPPVYVLGHSAGGVIASTYALDHQADIAGLVCESFAFRVPAPDIALQVIKGVSHLAPDIPILKLKNVDFSRDPAVVKAMNEDPLIHDETQPSITVAALQRADERLTKEIPTITLPVLIMHGTEDKATLPKGSQFFYDHAGSKDKTLKLYEGHYHDLLADVGKEGVLGDIVGWIAAGI
jgi:alpha-beta hydrolase superfamily lysophospholipase